METAPEELENTRAEERERGAGFDFGLGRGRAGRRERGAEMGEVESGMLLAVLERAWLGTCA